MVSGTESHLRIDDDVVFGLRVILVEGTVNHAAVVDDDGLKEILFPFLVPVLVFRLRDGITDACAGYRKIFYHLLKRGLVELALLDVGLHAVFTFHETFKTDVGCQSR